MSDTPPPDTEPPRRPQPPQPPSSPFDSEIAPPRPIETPSDPFDASDSAAGGAPFDASDSAADAPFEISDSAAGGGPFRFSGSAAGGGPFDASATDAQLDDSSESGPGFASSDSDADAFVSDSTVGASASDSDVGPSVPDARALLSGSTPFTSDTPPPDDDPFASEDFLEDPSDDGSPPLIDPDLILGGSSEDMGPDSDEIDAFEDPTSAETAVVLVQSRSGDHFDPVPSESDRMEPVVETESQFRPTRSERMEPERPSGKLRRPPAAAVAEAYASSRLGRRPMIQIKGMHKSFGARHILRGIDLEVIEGETVCIIGGSGTGKSVTLKHIMRLLDPDEGEIWLDGENITDVTGDQLEAARSKLGVNFQFGALLNWLTVFENVALPLQETTTMGPEEIERRVMQKLELLKIPHARDHYPNQISGGMVKRAGLARAVVKEESLKVILYDEPTSGLDPISTALVDEMVNEMKQRLGLTQIIVTHDMESVYRTADRIAVLLEGKVIFYDTPEAIRVSTIPYVKQFITGLTKAPD